MKKKARRAAAVLMALLLMVLLCPGPGRASGNGVYFTAANEQLLDLNSETMPFYSNGVLYVSSRVFEGGELGLSYGRNTTLGLATLYRQGSNMDLRFDIAGQVVYDKQYKTSSSIIYSANMLVDRVNYISSKNNKDKVQIAVELGWRRGVYLNLSVDVANTPAASMYEFFMFVILLTISMFNGDRKMTEEEQKGCKEVMSNAGNYNIKAN